MEETTIYIYLGMIPLIFLEQMKLLVAGLDIRQGILAAACCQTWLWILLNKGLRVSRVPKCLSFQMPWVLKYLWNALWVPNSPLSTLQVQKVWKVTRNRFTDNFILFSNTFQNTYFHVTLIVFFFLRNKIYKFYQILLKTFYKYFVKFQKTKYDGVRSCLLSNVVLQL